MNVEEIRTKIDDVLAFLDNLIQQLSEKLREVNEQTRPYVEKMSRLKELFQSYMMGDIDEENLLKQLQQLT